jgi:hypothetical protein
MTMKAIPAIPNRTDVVDAKMATEIQAGVSANKGMITHTSNNQLLRPAIFKNS